MNEPLGVSPPSPALRKRHRAAVSRAAIAATMAIVAAGAFALGKAPTDARQPPAVARVEIVPRVRASPPEATPAAGAATSSLEAISSADKLEAASGVKVVRSGGAGGTNALIIDVPQALGVRLPPAPDRRLAEKSRFGLLPRVGADGERPAEIYARPVVQAPTDKRAARVAILVGGLGIDAAATTAAIARLPAAVSLGFAPYGDDLASDVARAREAGHEILLQAPMEALGVTANPGPHTLTTAATDAENIQSLHWLMGRFTGYFGVTNYLGGKFTAQASALSPILAEIAARGLDYVDDGSSPRSIAGKIAPTLGAPATVADVVLDATPTPESIEAALARLEALARRQDGALGVATALPVSLEHIAHWAAALEARGVTLVPVSALVSRTPASTAQSDR